MLDVKLDPCCLRALNVQRSTEYFAVRLPVFSAVSRGLRTRKL